MTLCVENGFDILLTIDKNMAYQQNMDKYKVSIAVLNATTSKIEELVLFVPAFIEQAPKLESHKVHFIERD